MLACSPDICFWLKAKRQSCWKDIWAEGLETMLRLRSSLLCRRIILVRCSVVVPACTTLLALARGCLLPSLFYKIRQSKYLISYSGRQPIRITTLKRFSNGPLWQTVATGWSILNCILKVERGINKEFKMADFIFSMIDFSACGWSIELKFWI